MLLPSSEADRKGLRHENLKCVLRQVGDSELQVT